MPVWLTDVRPSCSRAMPCRGHAWREPATGSRAPAASWSWAPPPRWSRGRSRARS